MKPITRKTFWDISSKRSLLSTIVFSILMFTIAIIIGLSITNIIIGKYIQREIDSNNTRYLHSLHKMLDFRINNIQLLLEKYISDDRVEFIANGWFKDFREIQESQAVKSSIAWDVLQDRLVYDIVAVFKSNDFIISKDGIFSHDYYTNTFYKNIKTYRTFDLEETQNVRLQDLEVDYPLLAGSVSQELMKYVTKKVIFLTYGTSSYRISIFIDYAEIVKMALEPSYYLENELFIFTSNGQVLLDTGNLHDDFDYDLLQESGDMAKSSGTVVSKTVSVDNNRYYLISLFSDITGLYYSILYPCAVVDTTIRNLSLFNLPSYLVIILVGILLVLFYRKKLLMPFSILLQGLWGSDSKETRNEFTLVKNMLETLQKENSVVKGFLEDHRAVIRERLLKDLTLHQEMIEEQDFIRYFKDFVRERYVLLECYTDRDDAKFLDLMIDSIFSIVSKAAIPHMLIRPGTNCIIFVLNTDMESDDILELFGKSHTLGGLQTFRDAACFLSGSGSNLNQLPLLYSQLKGLYNGRNLNTNKLLYTCRDTKVEPCVSGQVGEFKNQLINLLKSGSRNGLSSLLKEYSIVGRDISFKEGAELLSIIQGVLREYIIDKVIFVALPTLEESSLLQKNPYFTVDLHGSEYELHKLLYRVQAELESLHNSEEDRIIRYIKENFSSFITLDGVADHFNMSRSYLSHYIKAKLGMTFTEYMNKLRLERAKKDLVVSEKHISEIATMLAFQTTSSFIRFFKKNEGCSPGQYRKRMTR